MKVASTVLGPECGLMDCGNFKAERDVFDRTGRLSFVT
jgi:hypothetical protein